MNLSSDEIIDRYNPFSDELPLIGRSIFEQVMAYVEAITEGRPHVDWLAETKAFANITHQKFQNVPDQDRAFYEAITFPLEDLFKVADDPTAVQDMLAAAGADAASPLPEYLKECDNPLGLPRYIAYLLILTIAATKAIESEGLREKQTYTELMAALDAQMLIITYTLSLLRALPTGLTYLNSRRKKKADTGKGGKKKAEKWRELKMTVRDEYLAGYTGLPNAKAARALAQNLPNHYFQDDKGNELCADRVQTINGWIPKIKKHKHSWP